MLAAFLSLSILAIPLGIWFWALLLDQYLQWQCSAHSFSFACSDALITSQQQVVDALQNFLLTSGLFLVGWAGILGALIWRNLESTSTDENYIRGAVKAAEEKVNELTASIRNDEPGPHIQFGNILFPQFLETLSMLACGSPGAGKTTAFQLALIPINQRSTDKVCVYDRNGDYLKKFYNPVRGDKVLGLTDLATHTWNLWDEFPDGQGFQKFVELAIPKEQGTTYWVDNGRLILLELLKTCRSWKELREIISSWGVADISKRLQGTPAFRPLVSKYAEEILSGVNSRTAWLDNFEDANPLEGPTRDGRTTDAFSFHEWATSTDNSWVFLLVPEHLSAESAPMLTVWFDLIAQAVMRREIDHTGFNRLWLVLDELSSVGYQPRLKDFLAEARKYGGGAMLGFQLISQIRAIYGVHETQTIFGLCQTKLILRTAEAETCKFLAENIGTQDYYEPTFSSSKSYSSAPASLLANRKNEGQTKGYQRRNDHLFLPSEIKDLPQFNAILVMPTFPTCQIKLKQDAHTLPTVSLPKPRKKLKDEIQKQPNLVLLSKQNKPEVFHEEEDDFSAFGDSPSG